MKRDENISICFFISLVFTQLLSRVAGGRIQGFVCNVNTAQLAEASVDALNLKNITSRIDAKTDSLAA